MQNAPSNVPSFPAARRPALGRAASAATLLWLVGLLFAGCASAPPARGLRPFEFARDTLAFTNETVWEYSVDPATGRQVHTKRPDAPTFSLRCFPMARVARQFHLHARFEPDRPRPDPAETSMRVGAVLARSPRTGSTPRDRIVLTGYTGLRDLSADRIGAMQEQVGGAWQSYMQRGHWRMVFPFSTAHQAGQAERFRCKIEAGEVPVAHVVTFPSLTINHAVLLHAVRTTGDGLEFDAYDPNSPGSPITLTFDRSTRRFLMPATRSFIGGPVDVYEVYGDRWH